MRELRGRRLKKPVPGALLASGIWLFILTFVTSKRSPGWIQRLSMASLYALYLKEAREQGAQ